MYTFGDNHGRDTESRQLSKIMAQAENCGNLGDREFVIYVVLTILLLLSLLQLRWEYKYQSASSSCYGV